MNLREQVLIQQLFNFPEGEEYLNCLEITNNTTSTLTSS